MEIKLQNIGKQYLGEWIFKSISLSFFSGEPVHISGGNGSGKSTLLKVLAGITLPSTGKIEFVSQQGELYTGDLASIISVCAPFIQLFDDQKVKEAVEFHITLSPLKGSMSADQLIDTCYLSESAQKRVGELSSGMKQRLKLALMILSDKPILILDEPCTNLDAKAISWYQELLSEHSAGKTVLISSNDKEEEHFICKKSINLADYK